VTPRIRRPARILPILDWGRHYDTGALLGDGVAAVIVTLMLIPQSLAYAMLAGLPPQVGLYASMLPLVAYALFGSSRTLAVGPVAIVSLMTATALAGIAPPGSDRYLQAAAALALLSGGMLLLWGVLRLGMLANFLSRPVIAGFITASGVLIAASQLRHIIGVDAAGADLLQLLPRLLGQLPNTHLPTLCIGAGTVAFLLWARHHLPELLPRLGLAPVAAGVLARLGPVVAMIATSLLAWWLQLGERGVALVGAVPGGLPRIALSAPGDLPWRTLLYPALLISIIGFVESVSVGHSLAARRGQKIAPDQELVGLGAANVAAALSGGYPVSGGFARSVVNFDAGARTPAAGAFTAVGIALTALFFTPWLAYLPQATLAATIIVAVLSLVDLSVIRRAWRFGRSDFSAVSITILVTLVLGVESGVACGMLVSLGLHLLRTSRPHMAVVGELPGTAHYRNVKRHQVLTRPEILSLRVDESLYFANAGYVEDRLLELLAERPQVRHVILLCTGVNEIDLSAVEVLEAINSRLLERGITLHLSEVKGPVMDLLRRTQFLQVLSGQVFLTHHVAVTRLSRRLDEELHSRVPNWEI